MPNRHLFDKPVRQDLRVVSNSTGVANKGQNKDSGRGKCSCLFHGDGCVSATDHSSRPCCY
jgi:hypothetical protein